MEVKKELKKIKPNGVKCSNGKTAHSRHSMNWFQDSNEYNQVLCHTPIDWTPDAVHSLCR